MSATLEQLRQRLTELRDGFDQSFVQPVQGQVVETEDLLAIRVADEPYAVRLVAVAGLARTADTGVTPLPGAPPQLLGVASVRRAIVAVYDLAALLRHARSAAPRWLILARGEPTVGLAFDRIDGHLRLPRAAIARGGGDGPVMSRRALADDVVHTSTGARAVIDISAVHAALVAAAQPVDQGRNL